MEDTIKVLTAKFNLSNDILKKVSDESSELSSWLNVLSAYILDNDRKQEEQRDSEALLRRQRLNAGKFKTLNSFSIYIHLYFLGLLNYMITWKV